MRRVGGIVAPRRTPVSMGERQRDGRIYARHRLQRGVVLVLTLWAGALLGAIAIALAFDVRADRVSIINAGTRMQAELLAESAINRALLGLVGEVQAIDWRIHGRVYEMSFEGGLLRASIHAESGKIDLNAAPEALLRGMIEAAQSGLEGPPVDTEAVTAAILDWRDDDGHVRPKGAEDPQYRRAGRDRGAGDRVFLSVDELGQVLGLSKKLFERLRPVVTVYTRAARVDPMTASRLALLAVPGLDRGRVDAFLSERSRLPGGRATKSDENTEVLLHWLAGAGRYLARAETDTFTIVGEGRTDDGVVAFRRAVVEVDRAARPPYRLLAWADEPSGAAREPED